MINKQKLWFLTLFSLILILGVYYVTLPNDLLEKAKLVNVKESKPVVEEVKEENSLTALRVNLQEERQEKIEVLQEKITSNKINKEEKNNLYEELKYLNEIQGKEENLEKKIKKEYKLDCFVKQENQNITVVCISNNHDTTIANNIMRLIQKEYEDKKSITVKFQKK